MILEFSSSNYKSIKNDITLSMMSTKDKEHSEILLEYGNRNVLPIISIYGANGSGKTNIINSLAYFKFIVCNSNNFQPGDRIPFFPHKLKKDFNSEFRIQIVVDKIRYAYGFSVNNQEIEKEYLYHFKNNKQAKIFERMKDDFYFGKEYTKDLKEVKDKMNKNNKLFLSIVANWINNEDIIRVFRYIKENIVINSNIQNEEWLEYTLKNIKESDKYKETFILFLRSLDINITDINVDIKNIKMNYEDLPADMPEELKMLISNSEGVKRDVKLRYDDLEIDLNEDSRGINKLFEISGQLDILDKGKVLVYDELETSLHPIIVKHIVKLFKNKDINKNNAQLIFTTHDTNLLDLDLLRRDQIWLTERNQESKSTEIYSLSDLKNIRSDENIENGYIRGKYGAIPFITNNLNNYK